MRTWNADLIQKLSRRSDRAAEKFALATANTAFAAEQRMMKGKESAKKSGWTP